MMVRKILASLSIATMLTAAAFSTPAATGATPADAVQVQPTPGQLAKDTKSVNQVFTMYSAPVAGTYVVGNISGSDQVQKYECIGGWLHIRTAFGVGGDHFQNTVAWVQIGC
ncbi:hypothetical protein ACWED2_09395 [Amycolatopsis sp. NPDC005003]